MNLLAIDPGKCMGWAYFADDRLANAGQGTFAIGQLASFLRFANVLVFEHPEIYRPRHSKGDPNKLAPLIKQIGWIQGYAAALGSDAVSYEYKPKEWKGQVPKNVHHKRAWKALKDGEHFIVPQYTKTDAWDAIALGLFHLKRIGRGGV